MVVAEEEQRGANWDTRAPGSIKGKVAYPAGGADCTLLPSNLHRQYLVDAMPLAWQMSKDNRSGDREREILHHWFTPQVVQLARVGPA